VQWPRSFFTGAAQVRPERGPTLVARSGRMKPRLLSMRIWSWPRAKMLDVPPHARDRYAEK